MTTGTQLRQHQWVEFKVTPIEVLRDNEGDPVPVPTGREPQVTYGCMACNMGLDEGKDVSCPGHDLFEEE